LSQGDADHTRADDVASAWKDAASARPAWNPGLQVAPTLFGGMHVEIGPRHSVRVRSGIQRQDHLDGRRAGLQHGLAQLELPRLAPGNGRHDRDCKRCDCPVHLAVSFRRRRRQSVPSALAPSRAALAGAGITVMVAAPSMGVRSTVASPVASRYTLSRDVPVLRSISRGVNSVTVKVARQISTRPGNSVKPSAGGSWPLVIPITLAPTISPEGHG